MQIPLVAVCIISPSHTSCSPHLSFAATRVTVTVAGGNSQTKLFRLSWKSQVLFSDNGLNVL